MRRISPTRRRGAFLAGVLCLAVGPAGCNAASGPADEETDRRLEGREMSRPLPERVEMPGPAKEQALPPQALLARVIADAAARSGLAQEELRVSDSRQVTWNDGSLGCPEPGMNYTQALVPGWHVLVTAGESTLDYRLAEQGYFRLCDPRHLKPGRAEQEGPSEEGPPRY